MSSYEYVYEINDLFRNRKSYFDLKLHNIFLRWWFMTHICKKITDLNDIYKILSYIHKSVTKLISDIFKEQAEGLVMVKHPII